MGFKNSFVFNVHKKCGENTKLLCGRFWWHFLVTTEFTTNNSWMHVHIYTVWEILSQYISTKNPVKLDVIKEKELRLAVVWCDDVGEFISTKSWYCIITSDFWSSYLNQLWQAIKNRNSKNWYLLPLIVNKDLICKFSRSYTL